MLCIVLITASAGGCSLWPFGGDDDERPEFEGDERVLYQSAQRSLRAGNYNDAIAKLEHLEVAFPFGRYAEQAQLELIFARYQAYQPDAARHAADRFIRLHPQHPNIDYAYYLKGLAATSKTESMFDRFFTTDFAKRDLTAARDAFNDFAQLVHRFPESEYALDARQRMLYLRNKLAESEINIARFYMRRNAFVAAANRARTVVEEYSTTPSVDDGLAILIEANYKLGLEESANDALRVLALNYPAYQSFDNDGQYVLEQNIQNRDRSWTNLVSFGLLDRPDVPPPIAIEYPDETPQIAPSGPSGPSGPGGPGTEPEVGAEPAATDDEPIIQARSPAEQAPQRRT